MSVIDEADVDEYVAVVTKDQPDWIRVVLWIGQLADPDGRPAAASTTVHRIIVHDSSGLRAEYGSTLDAYDAFSRMETSLAGVDWSELRIVVDRDGHYDVDVMTDEPLRPEEDSASDPYWGQVHDYLELNRAAVDELVVRLRASGDLPGAEATEERRRGGVLGYFRRD